MAKNFKLKRGAMLEVLNSPAVTANLRARAERVKSVAQTTAPRDTGALAASHTVQEIVLTGRPRVRVVANSKYGAIVGSKTGYLGSALSAGRG